MCGLWISERKSLSCLCLFTFITSYIYRYNDVQIVILHIVLAQPQGVTKSKLTRANPGPNVPQRGPIENLELCWVSGVGARGLTCRAKAPDAPPPPPALHGAGPVDHTAILGQAGIRHVRLDREQMGHEESDKC